jgi:hypothetical protein
MSSAFVGSADSLAGVGTGIPSLGGNGVLTAIMGKGKCFSLALTRCYRSIALAQDISQLGDRSLRVDSFEIGKETHAQQICIPSLKRFIGRLT